MAVYRHVNIIYIYKKQEKKKKKESTVILMAEEANSIVYQAIQSAFSNS